MITLDLSRPETRSDLHALRDRAFAWLEDPPADRWPLRSVHPDESPSTAVARSLREVRGLGDPAIARLQTAITGRPFAVESIRVREDAVSDAHEHASEAFLEALRAAIGSITRFHENALPVPVATYRFRGSTLETVSHTVSSTGILVPARPGAAVSMLLGTAIPAKVAGVERIAVAVTPDETGVAPPEILAAAHELGVREIHQLDPFPALAAFAFGSETVPAVDLLAGEGDLAVLEARKHISDRLLVNRIAGPSDLLVLADDTAPPAWIAADLIAAAEHSLMTSTVVVTDSVDLAASLPDAIRTEAARLAGGDTVIEALEASGRIVVAESVEAALDLIEDLAPQCVEILREDADRIAPMIRNAGVLFVGRFSPASIVDVCAGPGRSFPGGGSSRYASGLWVQDFRKQMLRVHFTEEGYRTLAATARALAGAEGLPGHERSIALRET